MSGRAAKSKLLSAVALSLAFAPVNSASAADFLTETGPKQQIKALTKELRKSDYPNRAKVFEVASSLVPSFGLLADEARDHPGRDRAGLNAGALLSATPELSTVPLDLLLSQLALQIGAENHVELRLAQPDSTPRVIALQSGSFTLETLFSSLEEQGLDAALTKDGDVFVLNWPLYIMRSARLEIQSGDQLNLNASRGVFIANMGIFTMSHANMAGFGINPKFSDFRPFIVSTLGGKVQIQDSRLTKLGFGERRYMQGVSFASNILYPVRTEATIERSWFRNVNSIELTGLSDLGVKDNLFTDSAGTAVRIETAKSGNIIGNVIIDGQKQGLFVGKSSRSLEIRNNIILGGAEAAITLGRGTSDSSVSENLLIENGKSGISLSGAACIEVTGNAILDNRTQGILSKDSSNLEFRSNVFAYNAGTAVTIKGDSQGRGTLNISANRFIKNSVGINASGFTELNLSKNDFSRQLPVLFEGEMKSSLTPYLIAVRKLADGASMPFLARSQGHLEVKNISNEMNVSSSSLETCNL